MKDTLKTLELLEQHIDRLAEQGIHEIERDLLLESLRGIYTSVLSIDTVAEEERVIEALLGLPEELLEPNDHCMYGCPPEELAELPEEESLEEDDEIETALIEDEQPTAEPEPIVVEEEFEESATEPEVEEEATEESAAVSEISDEIDHEAVMSLYDDEEDVEEVEEKPAMEHKEDIPTTEEAEQHPVVEDIVEENITEQADTAEEVAFESEGQSVVLGDILATEQTTIADNLAEQMVADVTSAAGANISLRSSIAINDKFILMRDLFAGNNDYYEMAINQLDSFDNLEDAMLYIHDNFHWNPNSEGARLLMELLARKLF